MRGRRGGAGAALAAIAAGTLCLLPLVFLLMLSAASAWRFPDLLPDRFEPMRWLRFWRNDRELAGSLALSIAISTTVALASTAAGFLAGRYVAYHRRRRALLMLAYLPFVISPVVVAICLLHVYIRLGLSGRISGVIGAQLLFTLGFAIVFFQGFWNERRRSLEDLVRTLGGTTAQIYGRVLLPISRPMLLLCFFQTFLVSWFQYGLTLLIGSGRVRTLPIKIYDYLGEANVAWAALASCLMIGPAVLMLWAGRWLLTRGAGDVS